MKICVTSGFCVTHGNVCNARLPINATSSFICSEQKPGVCISHKKDIKVCNSRGRIHLHVLHSISFGYFAELSLEF